MRDIDLKIRNFSLKKNSFGNVVYKMSTIRPQYVEIVLSLKVVFLNRINKTIGKDKTIVLNQSLEQTSIRSFHLGCMSGEFKCGRGNCIPDFYKCDGSDDCGDFSDEDPSLCSWSHFLCISLSNKCPLIWRSNKMNRNFWWLLLEFKITISCYDIHSS